MTLISKLRVGLLHLVLLFYFDLAFADVEGVPQGFSRSAEIIAAGLHANPRGSVAPCEDRVAWSEPSLQAQLSRVVKYANSVSNQKMISWSDDSYLEFSRTGVRRGGELMMIGRQRLLMPLVLAECIIYQGTLNSKIEEIVRELVLQKTWVLPAHDRQLRTFKGEAYFVDINAAEVADDLAQVSYLLRATLSKDLQELIATTLEKRIFKPIRYSYSGIKISGHEWLIESNNLNAVSLKGITSAALTVLPGRIDRARFVAAAHFYSRNYLSGFESDGYASEGLSYWSYGFSRYAELREKIMRATSGRVDLFDDSKVGEIALYGVRIAMFPDNAALFGDALPAARPDHDLIVYLNKALGLGLSNLNEYSDSGRFLTLFSKVSPVRSKVVGLTNDPLRHFFPVAGVLVARPSNALMQRLAVTIKAGGNTTHSHNDVGSYAIGLGKEQPVGDPGGVMYYNRETFGPNRYKSKVFNSFGHPVPVVAGRLQSEAHKVKVPSPVTRFSELIDDIRIDLAVAYDEPTLKSLTRSMRYDRTEAGSVRVEDQFEFTAANSFETAITSRGVHKIIDNATVDFVKGPERLRAKISASGPYELVEEKVSDSGAEFVRIGIRLRQPAADGYIAVEYLPMQ